jgi:hypothetical protein
MTFKLLIRDYFKPENLGFEEFILKIANKDYKINFDMTPFLEFSVRYKELEKEYFEIQAQGWEKFSDLLKDSKGASITKHIKSAEKKIKLAEENLENEKRNCYSVKKWQDLENKQNKQPVKIKALTPLHSELSPRKRAELKAKNIRYEKELENHRNKFNQFTFYLFKNNLYYFDDRDMHTSEERELLIQENYYKNFKKFETLKKQIKLFDKIDNKDFNLSREPIPEEIRFSVWRRDGGKCVKCGSKKNLEFDHIIPFSKGGSNSERNLQLLCQKCNREKSNKI